MLDPTILSKLLDGPPPRRDFFFQDQEFEEWEQTAAASEFVEELVSPEFGEDWLVVESYQEGDFHDRRFVNYVSSTVVPSETAPALARAIEAADQPGDGIYPRSRRISLDWCVRNVDELIGEATDEDPRFDDESYPEMFRMQPWTVEWYQEERLSDYDPLWPRSGRTFYTPAAEFLQQSRLTRVPNSFDYVDEAGNPVAVTEAWDDGYVRRTRGEDSMGVRGHRLLIKKSAIQQFLRHSGRSLALRVHLQRNRSYSWRRYRDEEDSYNHGTAKAFVFTSKGSLEQC